MGGLIARLTVVLAVAVALCVKVVVVVVVANGICEEMQEHACDIFAAASSTNGRGVARARF